MKIVERQDIHVEMSAHENLTRQFGNPSDEKAEIAACEEIVRQVRRHVDGVCLVVVTWKIKSYCSHCRSIWTEDSSIYNGGCCEEDEKNNPHPSAAK